MRVRKNKMSYLKTCTILFLVFFSISAVGQRTIHHTHEDRYYKMAIDHYEKEKYSTAQKYFEKALENEDVKNSLTCEKASFYHAICAVKLFNADAPYLVNEFVKNYDGSLYTDLAYYHLGGYYYGRKKYTEAIEAYSKASPEDLSEEEAAELYFKKGYSHFMNDEYEEATSSFSHITGKDTKYSPPALYYYSHIHYKNENYEVAVQGFLKVIDDPTFGPIAPYYISQIYFIQGRYEKVIEFTPKYLDKVTEKRKAEFNKIIAESYYRLERYEESIPYFETFFELAASVTKEDKYQLAYAYYKTGQYEKAISYFNSITGTGGVVSQNAHYYLGACYLKMDDKQNARLAFASASKMDDVPSIKEDALYNYALLTYELGVDPFNEAIRAFSEYIRLYPDSKRTEQAYFYLVQSYLNARNYKQALASLEKVKDKTPALNEAYQKIAYFRGVELYTDMQYKEAVVIFNKSLTQNAQPAIKSEAMYWKGQAYYQLRDYESAIEVFNSYLAIPGVQSISNYSLAYYNIAYAYYKKKNYSASIDWFQKYINLSRAEDADKKCDAYNRTGDCYYSKSEYYSAIDYYTRAAGCSKSDIDYSLYQKGLCLGITNKHESKISEMEKVYTTYPNSLYADNALYESALSYIKLQNTSKAIYQLESLVSKYPQSELHAKSLVQLGLLHYNISNTDAAISNYKKAITSYPESAEARDAMVGLKNIYVEENKVDEYFSFANSVPGGVKVTIEEKDSLIFEAAEKTYLAGNCGQALPQLKKYISEFPNGSFIVSAHFYYADCSYQKKSFDEALESFNFVISKPRTKYTESALLGAARIYIDKKDYGAAIARYEELKKISGSKGNILEANQAIMKSQYELQHYEEVVTAGKQLLNQTNLSVNQKREARFLIAKSYLELGRKNLALAEFESISQEVMSREGAESKFRVAEINFENGNYDKAEKIILEFSESSTPYEYWIARGFILWADIFTKRGDNFQALQTVNSIIDYYEDMNDGILDMAKVKKKEIVKLMEADENESNNNDLEIDMD